jgi:hypothetical protein
MTVCERLLGKPSEIGRAIGMNEKAAFHWRHANSSRDAGDLPSAPVMRRLLAYSDAHGLGLTAEHLIRGADEAEIAAILAARAVQPETGVAAE